jgi:hypothetical protein
MTEDGGTKILLFIIPAIFWKISGNYQRAEIAIAV